MWLRAIAYLMTRRCITMLISKKWNKQKPFIELSLLHLFPLKVFPFWFRNHEVKHSFCSVCIVYLSIKVFILMYIVPIITTFHPSHFSYLSTTNWIKSNLNDKQLQKAEINCFYRFAAGNNLYSTKTKENWTQITKLVKQHR